MKLLKDSPYLSKSQWRKLFTAMSIMVVALYLIAMVFSLCGSKYFILNYQNEQMDRMETWLRAHYMQAIVSSIFMTVEFSIIVWFVTKKGSKVVLRIAVLCLSTNSLLYFQAFARFVLYSLSVCGTFLGGYNQSVSGEENKT